MLLKTIALLLSCAVVTCAQTAAPRATRSPLGAPPPARVEARAFFREYALDHPGSGPAIVAIDEDDNVWVALAKSGKLARFANGAVELFETGAQSRPVGLAAGTRANGHPGVIWIAASYDNKLIRFDIASRRTREFKIEGDNSWPFNVALGPDGSVWFTQRASARIGRLDAATGKVQHFDLPTANSGPAGLAVDQRSGRVWFTESYADAVGVLDPADGRIREYRMSDSSTGLVSGPAGLALDFWGGVWFAKLEGKLGHLPAGSDTVEVIDVPSEAKRPAGIAVASNGDVWAVALDGNLLLRYNPARRSFILYPLPTGRPDEQPGAPPLAKTSRPFGIAIDRQGNVWCSEQYAGQLAVLDVAPPVLNILSPSGTVRTAEALHTIRALDRVGGVQRLVVTLDGKVVKPAQGRLNLRDLLPGRHKLEITATDAAGLSASAAMSFDYAPGQIALQEILRDLRPSGKAGEEAQKDLLASARDLSKGDLRANLDALRRQLGASAKLFRQFPEKVLDAVIESQKENAGQTVEVRLLDEPPFFSQREVVLRKGDTVRWKYDPPTNGHSIPSNLHRIEIEGANMRSQMLRAGESFAFRFEQAGEFFVRDTETNGAPIVVKVVSR
ncbi:MAG TPA: hypothetical protein VGB73_15885 [Pyrinomonadaceae bacterium]|jgi:virginiamycin B lyase